MTLWHFAAAPFVIHGAAMVVDEAWFHRRRGLPRWERWGHPADTATVLLCWVLALTLRPADLWIFVAAAVFSALFVTKDEWVHARACTGGEMWLHAFLFTMHPVLLFLAGAWLKAGGSASSAPGMGFFGIFLAGQAVLAAGFLVWQAVYWNGPWAPATAPAVTVSEVTPVVPTGINNAFYEGLGDRWHDAHDDPVALLRAEGRLKNPWVLERIAARFPGRACRVLDIGCGAGFLCHALSAAGHRAEGADLSPGSLQVARKRDITGRSAWRVADAYRLPWKDGSFDAVSALDFLEHVERPGAVIAEAARVLKPGGLFFFHTFNRNLLAYLVVIKGLEWFVRNTPARMHVLPLFIKPKELDGYCRDAGMRALEWTGLRPEPEKPAFWRMLKTGRVPEDFEFRFTSSLAISYLGMAEKNP